MPVEIAVHPDGEDLRHPAAPKFALATVAAGQRPGESRILRAHRTPSTVKSWETYGTAT